MQRILALAILVTTAACQTSDLTLPQPPQKATPGTVYGTVVYAVPGMMATSPAPAASITILGTGLSTIAGANGAFLLAGITQTSGQILIRFDSTGNGKVDHQKLISFPQDVQLGPGLQIDLGDVLVVANATVVGKALLGDKVNSATGHGGTTVFVPAGPFTTYTNDDGSYALTELPAGSITIQFFHSGYVPYEIDGIVLQAGEDFTASDVVLNPVASPPAPGEISGKITFLPEPSDPTSTVAAAVPSTGAAIAGTVQADGTFQIMNVPSGLYNVNISHTGYTTSIVNNVFVTSGNEVVLPGITLQAGNGVTDCTPGDPCTPTTPCATGKVDCSTGATVCMPSGTEPDGTQCGLNEVCKLGACSMCVEMAACVPTDAPCHTGATACSTGESVCVDDGMSQPNGTACGLNEVCNTGNCVACTAGVTCTPTENPCHTGTTSCTTGSPVCVDQGVNQADGMACGSGQVCNAGSCIACDVGAACTPTTNACHTGNISCTTGMAVCADNMNNAPDGTVCDIDKVCSAGICTECTEGAACTPMSNACHTGIVQCDTGSTVCSDNQGAQPNGTSCGLNAVCNAGACVSCQQGQSCTPGGNACHTGSLDCTSGTGVCVDTMGVLANGTTCGTGSVCSGGTCAACVSGGVCSPVNAPCHVGAYACNTGVPICVDQDTNVSDGEGCGMNEVCESGACVACTANVSCVPTANVCHAGLTNCGTGTSVCVDQSSPAADGTGCGTGLVCHAGMCVTSGFTLISASPPSVFVEQSAAPFTIHLANADGASLTSTTVTCTAPDGGGCLPASVLTDVNGQATFTPVLPRLAGTYNYTIASAGQGQMLVAVTATAPGPGTLYSLVNQSHTSGNTGIPGAGVLAEVGNVYGVTEASDGTIYFAVPNYHEVLRLSPTGTLSVVAGTGSGGNSGNGGPATAAQLYYPEGVALNQAAQVLYIADTSNNLIRAVDVSVGNATSGFISVYAGGGTGSPANGGDGLTALAATFNTPNAVAVGPDGAVYVTETTSNRIRRIDPVTHVINAWISGMSSQSCPSSGVALYDCYEPSTDNGCRVAWDPSGNAYVSGRIFGPSSGSCNAVQGIVRVNAGGSLTQVAGYYNGPASDGSSASGSSLPGLPIMAFDALGDLYLSFPNASVIKRIDADTDILTTIAGSGSNGFAGVFVPSAQGVLYQPEGIVVDANQNIVFADYENFSLRTISAPAVATMPITVTLTPITGTQTQTAVVDQQPPLALAVTVADPSGPLVGVPVTWTTTTPGAWLSTASTLTSSSGVASIQVRAGRAAGMYQFVATVTELGGQTITQTFTVNAVTATSGDIYTLANLTHAQGNASQPVPGVTAQIGEPAAVAVASDGTLYFGDWNYCVIRQLSPAGVLTTVAGTGSCGNSTTAGLAVHLPMGNPYGIALDEATQTLYVADNYYSVIRQINLATGTTSIFAGGGTATSAPYGDGAPASNAVFSSLTQLSIGPDGLLYVSDTGHYRVRTISLSGSNTINAVPALTGTQTCTSQPLALYDCGGVCSVAWDQSQNLYISARLTGTSLGCGTPYGVLRISHSTGAVSLVAGGVGEQTVPGFSALDSTLPEAPFLAVDADADLYLSFFGTGAGESIIQRIDAFTGELKTVAGTGTAGYAGDLVPAAGAQLWSPYGIVFDPAGNLVIADYGNYAIRTIATPTVSSTSTVTFTAATATVSQTAVVDQPPPNLLSVTLSDATGPIVGVPVQWAALTPGAWIASPVVATGSTGVSSVQVRAGRAVGMYQYSATFTNPQGQTMSQTFTVTAAGATSGDIYTLVNLNHIEANTTQSVPGVTAEVGPSIAVSSASDGTLYFGDWAYCVVRQLSPAGVLTTVAGTGTCGNSTASGVAVQLPIGHPYSVALNQATNTLYVADNQYSVIRAVNLTTGTMSVFAGGGTATVTPYGDGGPALNAVFSGLTLLAIGPDGLLYVTDATQGRVRTINLTNPSNTINGVPVLTGAQTCTSQPAALYDCYSYNGGGCSVAWDQAQNLYISGRITGTSIGCGYPNGILRISHATGVASVVAGANAGQSSPGFSALETVFTQEPPFIAVDADDDIYLSFAGTSANESIIQRIDAYTGELTTVAGTASAGYAGDMVPAAGAELNNPNGIAFDSAGNLLIADYGNYAIRTIATPPLSTASTLTFTAQPSAQSQTAVVDQPPPLLLSVTLGDAAGPLVGYPVQWAAVTDGAWIASTLVPTGPTGASAVQVRAGRAVGAYQYTATFTSQQGQQLSQSFTVHAVAAPVGDIYTLVNLAHAESNTTASGAGVMTETGGPNDISVAADGTLYIADYTYCVVRMLDPGGQLTTIAGTGSCGNTPGPTALTTSIGHVSSVAVSSSTQTLYIADQQYSLIHALDLVHGTMTTFAGGGTASAPGYGDGGSASGAVFKNITRIAIGPDGLLYVTDQNEGRVRTIDLTNSSYPITSPPALTAPGACQSPMPTVAIYDCYYANSCTVAWDSAENLYVSARLYGSVYGGCNVYPGIIRISHATGVATLVAGSTNTGQTSTGYSALATQFPNSPMLAIDASNNIYLSFPNQNSGPTINQIDRIDASSGKLYTIAGSTTIGYAGDLVPSTQSQINNPFGLAVDPGGNLIFADYSNYAVRTIASEASIAGSAPQLTYVSGNSQSTMVDEIAPTPFAVKLVDTTTGNPLVGYPVQWTSLTPGAGFAAVAGQNYVTTVTTDATGTSTVQARAGLIPTGTGTPYQFTASFSNFSGQAVSGSPISFSLTATSPASGTIFTAANVIHVSGDSTVQQPGPFAGLGQVRGMTTSPTDGSIYFADYGDCVVRRLSTAGDLTTVAGNYSCGYTGDLGPATLAQLSHPSGVAIDPTGKTLYIADFSNNVVRAVSFATGLISTFAGEGSEPSPYGDSGPPLSANLYQPTHLAFGPDTRLYITDLGHERIRYVDFPTNTINTFIATTGNGSSANPVSLFYCNSYAGSAVSDCQIAWDSLGNAYVSGLLAGTSVGSTFSPGIMEIAGGVPSGAQTLVAGHYQGVTTNGALATATVFSGCPLMAFDASNNLFTVDPGGNQVRKITAATGDITTVVSTSGTAGYLGDYVAATGAELNSPWSALVLPGGHLLVSDQNNDALREIW